MSVGPGKTLLIDADDTLWENNVYFERVIEEFLKLAEELNYSPPSVRQMLNDIERRSVQINGYGSANFISSLKQTLLLLLDGTRESRPLLERIDSMAARYLHRPIELLPGVDEALIYLSARHTTILFTKGDVAEQTRKIEASGLLTFFQAFEIAREKNLDAFLDLMNRHHLEPNNTWMIGNSCKSDINPAVAAGLNAVYIPHPKTWDLEKESLTTSERIMTLGSFSELPQYF